MKLLNARIAADVVALSLRNDELHVALTQRKNEPAKGLWSLPGTFLREEESAEDAAAREITEELDLPREQVRLEQLASYSDPARDAATPSERVLTVAFVALASALPDPAVGTAATAAEWVPVEEALSRDIAFDHARIIRDGVERARGKLEYTTQAVALLPETFTMSDLRRVYETVWGTSLDAANFNRKVLSTPGFVIDTGEQRRGRGRPAALYRAGDATRLNPPLHR